MTHCPTEKTVLFNRRVRRANVVTGQNRKARREAIDWNQSYAEPRRRPTVR